MPRGVFDNNGSQVMWNGDAIAFGRRVGLVLGYRLAENFDVVAFGARRVDSTPNTTRWRGQLMLKYQLAHLFQNLFSRRS